LEGAVDLANYNYIFIEIARGWKFSGEGDFSVVFKGLIA
jgi:hypothetical protein